MRRIEDVILKYGRNLKEVLKLHKKWLEGVEGGEVANLSNEDLSDVDLSNLNLEGVYLINTYLTCTNLKGANLEDAILMNAYLKGANLEGANLMNAYLRDANLEDVKYNDTTAFFELQCPKKGSFIGYKKADNKIVKLLITEDAKRSSATTRKCRCSKAKVLSITSLDGKEEYTKVASDHNSNFIYEVGKIVEVENFDENRWKECTTGIHFFITRDEAVMYKKF